MRRVRRYPGQVQQAFDLRHQRCRLRRIIKVINTPLPTPGRAMHKLRLGRLQNLKPKSQACVNQWQRMTGEKSDVDSK